MALSSNAKSAVLKIVEDIFDKIALKFLGNIPNLKGKKLFAISAKPNLGLANLFVQAMDNRPPNSIESKALLGLLDSAHGYIDALKTKTQENIIEKIDSGENPSDVLDTEFEKASSHMKMIVGSETTKVRNVGFTLDFTRVAADMGDMDPNCYFVMVKDSATCPTCIKLHLNSDGTPRVFKYSEIKQGYYVRGEDKPSIFGAHPFCRCTLVYLPKGYGFNANGKGTYISREHDEFKKQRS